MSGVYNVKVYHRSEDAALVVDSGGLIVVKTGGKIVPNSETQAAHIANATGGVTISAAGTAQAKINAIIAAMQNVGILATS